VVVATPVESRPRQLSVVVAVGPADLGPRAPAGLAAMASRARRSLAASE
jgi:hypothetical protein